MAVAARRTAGNGTAEDSDADGEAAPRALCCMRYAKTALVIERRLPMGWLCNQKNGHH